MGQRNSTNNNNNSAENPKTLEFDREQRQRILQSEISEEERKQFEIPLSKWRQNESLEQLKHRRHTAYRCKKREIIRLNRIPTWNKQFSDEKDYFKANSILETKYKVNYNINSRVSIFKANIVHLEIDAIVNAANASLLGGGGVDHYIHAGAGRLLQRECATLTRCKTGEAKITKGYNLPAKYVIHTVGPCVMTSSDEDPVALASCYTSSLNLALKHNIRSIAFCCISTGVYGYPLENATKVAMQAVRAWLDDNWKKVDRIVFDVFLDKEERAYRKWMPAFFPCDPDYVYQNNSSSEEDPADTISDDDDDEEEEQ